MRFAYWLTKATDTHSECVILIAFPLQQWLHEQASVLRHTYIVCPVILQKVMYVKDSGFLECDAVPLGCCVPQMKEVDEHGLD